MKRFIDFIKSFKYAFEGLVFVIKNERNVRVHLTCLTYMIGFLCFSDWFVVSNTQFAVLLLTGALVISLEFVNTAVESAVNLCTKEFAPFAKIAKDTAAAAVLVAAVFAVFIGITILYQPEAFAKMFEYFTSHLIALFGFMLSLVVAIMFIFFPVPTKKGDKNDR